MGIGGLRVGCYRALRNKGVHRNMTGNNRVVCSSETNIQHLYSHRENRGFH